MPKAFMGFMAMVLTIPMLVTAYTSAIQVQAMVHPQLLAAAAQNPAAMVKVIVQKSAKTDAPDKMVEQLGGTVTSQLNIINAFVAKIPAGSISRLAAAGNIRAITPDAKVVDTSKEDYAKATEATEATDAGTNSNLISAYPQSTGATSLWNNNIQGQGVTVAVVDSGVNGLHEDLKGSNGASRVVVNKEFSPSTDTHDGYGHGTHVAGIIGGNGARSNGGYIGMAPKVNLINVKVGDDNGNLQESDVIAGLEWIYNNHTAQNIKVVNLSLTSSLFSVYHISPLDAAAEILWFNRIVVVVAAGNNGIAALNPPANDPFVITVGAVDDKGTPGISDDTIPSYSAYGVVIGGVGLGTLIKPDLVAPGTNIISTLASTKAVVYRDHAPNRVNNYYFRMSGTSMAAPVVAGAVALLLQDEPTLNPDQVKYRLKATANHNPLQWQYNLLKAGAGYLDIYAAVNSNTNQTANTGQPASLLLWTGSTPPIWGGGTTWNSVNWSSVNWSSVNWSSVNWSNG
ncbi:MAG: S8 family peptidase, partial [Chloroflexia bacterium]